MSEFILGDCLEYETLNDLQIGKAGEYLVCADLALKGFVAYPSEQGLPYDVVLDMSGKLTKIQVKTTRGPRATPQRKVTTYSYIFDLSKHGRERKQKYAHSEVDMFALVALDTMQIGYVRLKDFKNTITLRVDRLRDTYHDEKGKQDYEKVMALIASGLNQSETARQTGVAIAIVNKMCQPRYKPYMTGAKYFSDIVRGKEWFYDLQF